MPLSEFLAQVDFLTPMIFRISVAAELALFALAKIAQTASPSQDCQPLGWPWDSLNAQAPLAKIDIRSKSQPGAFWDNRVKVYFFLRYNISKTIYLKSLF